MELSFSVINGCGTSLTCTKVEVEASSVEQAILTRLSSSSAGLPHT